MEVAAASPPTAQMPTGIAHQNRETPPLLSRPSPPAALSQQAVTPGSGSVLVTTPGAFPPLCIAAPKQAYPAPLTEHLAVVADKELFLETLTKFHLALALASSEQYNFQVIKDRKWKEITGAFSFPRTTTSASFVLRKYYITLLHHYEQLYFFGSSGVVVSPPTLVAAPSPVPVKQREHAAAPEAHAEVPEVINTVGKKIRKRRLAPMPVMASVDPISSVGNVVTGAIEGKFEHGYLVTVVVGNEKLRGVMYHVPPEHVRGPQYAHIPSFMLSSRVLDVKLPGDTTSAVPAKEKKRKQREELKKDPNAPRSSRTGYNFFFVEERAKLKLMYPDKERELSRMVGDAWNALTEEQKLPFQERGAKDKERYEREMHAYRQSKGFQAGSSINTTTPQELVRPEAAAADVATLNAGDIDHRVELNPQAAAVPVVSHQFFLDPLQQQLVNSSSSSEQQSMQLDPPHLFENFFQSTTETPSWLSM